MKLAEWARSFGVPIQTAYLWFREGRMPMPARLLLSGRIVVGAPYDSEGRTVVYMVRLTSMRARLYVRRGARNWAMCAVTAAKHELGGDFGGTVG